MEENPFQAASDDEPVAVASAPSPLPKQAKKRPSILGRFLSFSLVAFLAVGAWFAYQTFTTGADSFQLGDKVAAVGKIISVAKGFLPGTSDNATTNTGAITPEAPASAGTSRVPNNMTGSVDPTVPKPEPVGAPTTTPPTTPTSSVPSGIAAPTQVAVVEEPAPPSEPEKEVAPFSPDPPKIDPTEILRKKIESDPESSPSLYLKLAEAYRTKKTPGKAEEILRKGLAFHALEGELTLSLADSLSAQGNHTDAWMLIARTGRIGDLKFASKMLKLGLASGKHDETLVILDPSLTGEMEWSSADWENIARLHEKVGNLDNAITLFSKIPDGQLHLLRLRAKEAHAADEFDNALKLQSQYVNQLLEPDPEAWTFYADLHRQAGNNEEADEAYRRAFADLKKRDAAKG